MIVLRAETPADYSAIRAINVAAFAGSGEADLVDRLRMDGDLVLSLVAEGKTGIVGHCGFSRLTMESERARDQAVALAPVAIFPALQRRGIGGRIIGEGLTRLRASGERLVIVLGEPDYYARFGFIAAAAPPFRAPYDGPHLQALRLRDDACRAGAVRYPRAFADL